MDIIKFATIGSVDDGKSTLIGRLLYDMNVIPEDQLKSVIKTSKREGTDLNLALLTDGLSDERSQGITIDVAYRYFSSTKRKYILADTPGHKQYTRNTITGISNVDLGVLMVDVTKGLLEQSKRHCLLASLMSLPRLVICVNKMDLANFSETEFLKVRKQFSEFSKKLEIKSIDLIPVSALNGDNIVNKSKNMNWYEGPSLMEYLDSLFIASAENFIDFRFPVQTTIKKPMGSADYTRLYAGTIFSGKVKKNEEIVAMPSGFKAKIKAIYKGFNEIEEASIGESISIELADEIDISRGDVLCRPENIPMQSQNLQAYLCWMDHEKLDTSKKFHLIHGSHHTQCIIKNINYIFDVETLSRNQDIKNVQLNDIAKISFRAKTALNYDPYQKNRLTGSFILVDPITKSTAAAGMLL